MVLIRFAGDDRRPALILTGQRELVAQWVASRIRHQEPFVTGYEAIGAIDSAGSIIGGFVYSEHRAFNGGGSVAICAAGERDWLSRGNLKVFFGYPFLQLGCHRMQAMVAKSNKRARKVIERLGFVNEGCVRQGLGPNKDAILYSLLRHDCRWIKGITHV
jgi:RimJ/RimL family protein N-acetyltransferase